MLYLVKHRMDIFDTAIKSYTSNGVITKGDTIQIDYRLYEVTRAERIGGKVKLHVVDSEKIVHPMEEL